MQSSFWMSSCFHQPAQIMMARHIDSYTPYSNSVRCWIGPAEPPTTSKKSLHPRSSRLPRPIRCCLCSKPYCSGSGTACLIPNRSSVWLPVFRPPPMNVIISSPYWKALRRRQPSMPTRSRTAKPIGSICGK